MDCDQDFNSLDLDIEIFFSTVSVVHFKFLIFVAVILMIFEGQTSLICKLEISVEKGRGHLFSSN